MYATHETFIDHQGHVTRNHYFRPIELPRPPRDLERDWESKEPASKHSIDFLLNHSTFRQAPVSPLPPIHEIEIIHYDDQPAAGKETANLCVEVPATSPHPTPSQAPSSPSSAPSSASHREEEQPTTTTPTTTTATGGIDYEELLKCQRDRELAQQLIDDFELPTEANVNSSGDVQTGRKRKRATEDQVHLLEKIFALDSLPSTEMKQKIAKRLKMNPKRVQIWFQNKRARLKKLEEQKSAKSKDPFTFHHLAICGGGHLVMRSDGAKPLILQPSLHRCDKL